MISALMPQYSFKAYTNITPEFLRRLGISFLMLDLDNTIAKYSEHAPSSLAMQWVEHMRKNDIGLFFISNSKRETRVDAFAHALGVPFIKAAGKPSPAALLEAMDSLGFAKCDCAFLGDQVFTDTLAANRAAVTSIIVRPLSLKNPFFLLRFAVETPFRAICAFRNRQCSTSEAENK